MKMFRSSLVQIIFVALLAGPSAGSADEQSESTVNGILKAMTDTLSGAKSITLHVEKTFDDILVTGQKVQHSGSIDIALRRPDRLYVSYGDDFTSREVWFDGDQFVLQDHLARVHGQLPAADTVDETLDEVAEIYNVVLPLAGLLANDLQQRIDANEFLRTLCCPQRCRGRSGASIASEQRHCGLANLGRCRRDPVATEDRGDRHHRTDAAAEDVSVHRLES